MAWTWWRVLAPVPFLPCANVTLTLSRHVLSCAMRGSSGDGERRGRRRGRAARLAFIRLPLQLHLLPLTAEQTAKPLWFLALRRWLEDSLAASGSCWHRRLVLQINCEGDCILLLRRCCADTSLLSVCTFLRLRLEWVQTRIIGCRAVAGIAAWWWCRQGNVASDGMRGVTLWHRWFSELQQGALAGECTVPSVLRMEQR